MEVKQLSEDHKKRMGHITKMINDIAEMAKLLHPINSKQLGKKERSKVCEVLVNKHILPMNNIMLNLYVQANGLEEYFTQKEEAKEEEASNQEIEASNQSVN